MRVTLMHNPTAGDGKHDAAELLALLRDAGHQPRYQSTKEDAWKKTLRAPTDVIIAAGGDGTVGKIARRLVGRGVPLVVLPLGTANNLARTLGFDAPAEEIIARLGKGTRRQFDVGAVAGAWKRPRYFIEGAGGGLLPDYLRGVASLVKAVNKAEPVSSAEEMERHIAVLRELLATYEPWEWQIRLDDEDVSGRYILFEVMNIRSVGPVLTLAPEATTNDGCLDFVAVRADERDALEAYLEARLHSDAAEFPVRARPCRRVQVCWRESSLHIDDKLWPQEDKRPSGPRLLEIAVAPGALDVLLPDRGFAFRS